MRNVELVGGMFLALVTLPALALSPALEADLKKLPASKQAAIRTMIQNISKGVIAQHEADKKKDPKAPATRDAHPKHHGCPTAEFVVRANLATTHPDLAVGVLDVKKTGRPKFPAYIRYSNGVERKDDQKGDARGMAIKLMDVPGDKLLEDEKETQDFVMINQPRFFVHTLEDYLDFQKAMANKNPLEYAFPKPEGLNPLLWKLPRVSEFAVLLAFQADKTVNPIDTQYFSMVPVKLGNTPMKYSVAPCRGQRFVTPPAGEDQLRVALRNQLDPRANRADVCLEFMVQKQTHPAQMPVENSVVQWSETLSPYVPVARINLKPQTFDGADQMKFCEDIAMTPWHSIAEHEPLGDIQLARKFVYQAISELRHERNIVKHVEPRP